MNLLSPKEARKRRLAGDRARRRQRLASETAEQRETRLSRRRRAQERHAARTSQARETRLQQQRTTMREVRAMKMLEEREARLLQLLVRYVIRQASFFSAKWPQYPSTGIYSLQSLLLLPNFEQLGRSRSPKMLSIQLVY